MENEFVIYQLALRMKSLGFDEPCFGCFDSEGEFIRCSSKSWDLSSLIILNDAFGDNTHFCLSPTWQSAFRWFREKYNIFPEILTDCTTRPKFCYTYTKFFGNQNDLASEEWGWEPNVGQYSLLYKTYEEAQIDCLEKLIEIAEQI
jgi:hypothetical protein